MAADPSTGALDPLKIEALANGRYHADREAFLGIAHRWLIAGVIVLGASAVGDVWPGSKNWAALGSVLLGTIDLVFSLVERSRAHAVLRERYFDIAADLAEPGASALDAQRKLLKLAGSEEPPYFAAHALAENWATQAVWGDARTPCRVGKWARRFRHFRRFDGSNFATPKRSGAA